MVRSTFIFLGDGFFDFDCGGLVLESSRLVSFVGFNDLAVGLVLRIQSNMPRAASG